MARHSSPKAEDEELLLGLAEDYLWCDDHAEALALAELIRAHLSRVEDETFNVEQWARDLFRRQALEAAEPFQESALPFIVRAAHLTGICVGQWWNSRHELITAVQMRPGERIVLVEAGIETLERQEVVDTLREEIAGVLARARFLGLDQVTTRLLCEEGLTTCAGDDYKALRDEAAATETLGDGEGIRHLVRVAEVELLERFQVKVRFDDGVTRTLNLEAFMRSPQFLPLRDPALFVQLRVAEGELRWSNGATLPGDLLRYYPALRP